ncbi:MAG: hypothetical protein M1826_005736 [Phylliscum demangeonii]|nr:MAG: hypothetical protein M1826_005736 [Phylliscum demangeonii]
MTQIGNRFPSQTQEPFHPRQPPPSRSLPSWTFCNRWTFSAKGRSWSEHYRPWTVIRLTPPQLHQLEQLSNDPIQASRLEFELQARLLSPVVLLKSAPELMVPRFGLDRSKGRLIVRMATAPHEYLILALTREIERRLEAIGHDETTTMAVRENAQAIEGQLHPSFRLPASRRSPDRSFQHANAVYPDVVLDVANSQNGKKLKKLAREYLATSAGLIHVVIGVKLDYGATKPAMISVWRSSWTTREPDGGRLLNIVRDPVDRSFRDNDGLPVDGAPSLHLSDFVPWESAAVSDGALNPPIEIPFRLLHDALEKAERRDERARTFQPPPRDYSVAGECSDSSHDELTASDELVVQRIEEGAEQRAELQDPSYVG